ncbi:hypothetical protein VTI74DRAFT_4792 [Chaetomium olivicolor]
MLDNTIIPRASFTLTDSEEFYKDIAEIYGIDREWIKFGNCLVRTNNGCQYAREDVLACQDEKDNFFHHYPLANYDKIEIYNPKKIISDSLPNIPFVSEAIGAAGIITARTLLRLIGSVGDAGMAIHDVVEDPSNAFMTVFSYLLGAGVGRAGFKNAA